jgi:hypothetical protein
MSELKMSEDKVREEHLAEVNIGGHWAYLFGVLLGSTLLMIGLIAVLGSASQ